MAAGTRRLSLGQARRIALAAQGLQTERPTGPATARQVGRTFDRLQLLQIDSVNVLSRAHYLPLFARLGPYDRSVLDRFGSRSPRRMVEYWAHEASFVRPEHYDDLRVWQRRRWVGDPSDESIVEGPLARAILEVLEASRPLTARQVEDKLEHQEVVDRVDWGWNWSRVKRTLEILFMRGDVGSAGRTAQFERKYAPAHRVLPGGAAAAGLPDRDEAMLRLVDAAARAHGIGTVRCLADYFRVPVRAAAPAVDRLVADGVLEPVDVEGWPGTQFLHQTAVRPRAVRGRALLGPFDSLVFERRRVEELFGFRYRIEIYTPAERRVHGYYVLPFLLGERLVARVDLKAHHNASVLEVRGAFGEPDAPVHTGVELAAELRLMADWLGLSDVVVQDRGGLAPELAGRLRSAPDGTIG